MKKLSKAPADTQLYSREVISLNNGELARSVRLGLSDSQEKSPLDGCGAASPDILYVQTFTASSKDICSLFISLYHHIQTKKYT